MAGPVAGSPIWKPWRLSGTEMAPQVLLMNKLLFVLLLLHRFPAKLSGPFLPFLESLDHLPVSPDVLGFGLYVIFWIAGVLLLLNARVRVVSAVLGLVIIFFLLGSKPAFRNHLFICGCIFFLSALHKADERPWLIYLQMSVVYLGAGLNKLLDTDWHSGAFMHNWLFNARANPFYIAAEGWLPDMSLAILMSYVAIAIELTLAGLFLLNRTRSLAVWLAILFHWGLFILLRGENFGHFLEDILIVFIGFLSWPQLKTIDVKVNSRAPVWVRFSRVANWLNWDRQFRFRVVDPAHVPGLSIHTDQVSLTGSGAARYIVRYVPGWYVFLFLLYTVLLWAVTPPFGFVLVVLIGTLIVAALFPFPRSGRRARLDN